MHEPSKNEPCAAGPSPGAHPDGGGFLPSIQPVVVVAGLTVAALVCAVGVGLGRLSPIQDEVVSQTSVVGRNPFDFYAVYAAGIIAVVVCALFVRTEVDGLARALSTRLALACLIGVWVLNSNQSLQGYDLGITRGDTFHEGEYLGFRNAYETTGLAGCQVIHGPVLDLGPGVLAGPYDGNGYSVALARLVRSLFGVVALLGLLWVVWELVQFYAFGRTGTVFLLAIILVISLEGWVYEASTTGGNNHFRDAVFWPQTALTLRWLRGTIRPPVPACPGRSDLSEMTCGVALGAISAGQLLVSYERALNGSLIVLAALALAVVCLGLRAVARFAAGLGLGVSIVLVAVGPVRLSELVGQVRYWSRYGDRIFALPLGGEHLWPNRTFVCQAVATFSVLGLVVREGWTSRTSFRQWLGSAAPVALLLLATGLTQRRFLARPDVAHFNLAGPAVALLLVGCTLWVARRYEPGARWITRAVAALPRYGAAVLVLLVLLSPHCNPLDLGKYVADWRRNETKVDEVTAAIAAAMRKHLGNARSTYVLDSSGMWYYLLGVRSPSKFHQVAYAYPPESQREVVECLKRDKTRVILCPPAGFRFDGLPLQKTVPAIYQYVLTRYRPVETLHGYTIYLRKSASGPAREVRADGATGPGE